MASYALLYVQCVSKGVIYIIRSYSSISVLSLKKDHITKRLLAEKKTSKGNLALLCAVATYGGVSY